MCLPRWTACLNDDGRTLMHRVSADFALQVEAANEKIANGATDAATKAVAAAGKKGKAAAAKVPYRQYNACC